MAELLRYFAMILPAADHGISRKEDTSQTNVCCKTGTILINDYFTMFIKAGSAAGCLILYTWKKPERLTSDPEFCPWSVHCGFKCHYTTTCIVTMQHRLLAIRFMLFSFTMLDLLVTQCAGSESYLSLISFKVTLQLKPQKWRWLRLTKNKNNQCTSKLFHFRRYWNNPRMLCSIVLLNVWVKFESKSLFISSKNAVAVICGMKVFYNQVF